MRRGEHIPRRAVERRQCRERIAPRSGQFGREIGDGRHVLGAQRGEEIRIVAITRESRTGGECSVDANVAQVEMQALKAGGRERRKDQSQYFDVTGDGGLPEEFRTDLQNLAGLRAAGEHRAQHAARIAEPRHSGLVQQVRVDSRDLRRDVRTQADEAAGQRVDDFEGLQFEVAAGAREQ